MMPKTRDELKAAFREVLHEEFELIGIDVSTVEARMVAQRNFRMLGTIAGMIDSTAKKVGYAILMAALCALLWLAGIGLKLKMPS